MGSRAFHLLVHDVQARGRTAVMGTRALKLVALCPASILHRRRTLLVGRRHVASCRSIVRSIEHHPQGSTATSGGSLHGRCISVFRYARDNRVSTNRFDNALPVRMSTTAEAIRPTPCWSPGSIARRASGVCARQPDTHRAPAADAAIPVDM